VQSNGSAANEQLAIDTATRLERETPFERPLTSMEVGVLLGRNHKTIERHAKRGDIPAHFRLNRWYFLRSEIDKWLSGDLDSSRQPCRVVN
jgi:predicted DNA-binding transcriptional regulator AlpA